MKTTRITTALGLVASVRKDPKVLGTIDLARCHKGGEEDATVLFETDPVSSIRGITLQEGVDSPRIGSYRTERRIICAHASTGKLADDFVFGMAGAMSTDKVDLTAGVKIYQSAGDTTPCLYLTTGTGKDRKTMLLDNLERVGGGKPVDWQVMRLPRGITAYALGNGMVYETLNLEGALVDQRPDQVEFKTTAAWPDTNIMTFVPFLLGSDPEPSFIFGTTEGLVYEDMFLEDFPKVEVVAIRRDPSNKRVVVLCKDGLVCAMKLDDDGRLDVDHSIKELGRTRQIQGTSRIVFTDAGKVALLSVHDDRFTREIID